MLRIKPKNEGQTEASVVHRAELLLAIFKEVIFYWYKAKVTRKNILCMKRAIVKILGIC